MLFKKRVRASGLPLHKISLALWGKRLEAMPLSDSCSLLVGPLLMFLVMPNGALRGSSVMLARRLTDGLD